MHNPCERHDGTCTQPPCPSKPAPRIVPYTHTNDNQMCHNDAFIKADTNALQSYNIFLLYSTPLINLIGRAAACLMHKLIQYLVSRSIFQVPPNMHSVATEAPSLAMWGERRLGTIPDLTTPHSYFRWPSHTTEHPIRRTQIHTDS